MEILGKLASKLTSRGALAILYLFLILYFGLCFYSISKHAEISFSKGLLTITPKGSEKIKELEEQIKDLDERLAKTVPISDHEKLKDQFEKLETDNRNLRNKCDRLIAASGATVKEGEEKTIKRIRMLAKQSHDIKRNITVSIEIIRDWVNSGWTINTESIQMSQETRDLYKHIQRVLRCIGEYNGLIDGDQANTCRAVKQFQNKKKLKIDGIVGRFTLAALEKAMEEMKLH